MECIKLNQKKIRSEMFIIKNLLGPDHETTTDKLDKLRHDFSFSIPLQTIEDVETCESYINVSHCNQDKVVNYLNLKTGATKAKVSSKFMIKNLLSDQIWLYFGWSQTPVNGLKRNIVTNYKLFTTLMKDLLGEKDEQKILKWHANLARRRIHEGNQTGSKKQNEENCLENA